MREAREPIHVNDNLRVEHVVLGTPVLSVLAGAPMRVKRTIAVAFKSPFGGAGIYLSPLEARCLADALQIHADEAEQDCGNA